jgi:hypothetical protein
LRLVVAELRMMKEVYALSPRQRRILAGLTRGDLIWEVPDKLYFKQFNAATGRDGRLRLDELLQMQESGWIRRVSQGPNRLDHWEITAKGQDVLPSAARKRSQATTMQNTLCTCGHHRYDHAAKSATQEIGGGECLFPVGPEQRMNDGTLLQDLCPCERFAEAVAEA